MANKDNEVKLKNVNKLRDLADSIQKLSNDIYGDTYYTSKDSSYDLDNIKDGINKSLDRIFQKNMDISGKPNISTLYTRLMDSSDTSNAALSALMPIFEDQQLMNSVANSYAAGTYIQQYDSEIDLICKYMPRLEEAIEVKKDMVLCADQFNKDFITIRNKSSIENDAFFNSEIEIMKEKYALGTKLDSATYEAYKYGEQFLYIVPCSKAIERIFHRRTLNNQYIPGQAKPLTETVEFDFTGIQINSNNKTKDANAEQIGFTVTFNRDNALTESIVNMFEASMKLQQISEQSINESSIEQFSPKVIEALNEAGITLSTSKISSNKIIPDDTIPDKDDDDVHTYSTAVDGIIMPKTKSSKDDNKIEISKIPGCLIKRLPRHKVIPIYIEDICMGYYYIEIQNDLTINNANPYNFNMMTTNALQGYQQRGYGLTGAMESDPIKNDNTLNQIAAKLSGMIDKKFINANQDLHREIYMILKYDEEFNQNTKNINVTFIPPDDIEHIYFKMNPDTHRGISLLDKAIIPAKIFIALSMSSAIGMLTRGQDKRVFYVKQQVETNISKTLLSAINQIKKGNFGVRNLENLMNVLNITGQYNDYFIPRSANGDSPIDFEVLQGQDINPNTDFLEKYESYAIGTTGIPLELIDARLGIDYASQLTMTNTKHMRLVYKDQSIEQSFGSRIVTKIYNAEFNKNSQLALILPPPLYVTITNSTQLLTNVSEYAEKVISPELKKLGADDDTINAAIADYTRKVLGTYINYDLVDEIIKQALLDSGKRKAINSDQE